jgi:hypothetical protein
VLTRDFIFDALYSPTDGYFGTKGEQVRRAFVGCVFVCVVCGLYLCSAAAVMGVVGCDLASSLCCGVVCLCAAAAAAVVVVV